MEIGLTRLPWYGQLGTFLALGLAACGAFYYYHELPQRAEMAVRETRLHALRLDINTGLAASGKLKEFRRDVDTLERRLAELRVVLPEEKDAADLLRAMQTVALQSNLTITSFRPAPMVTRELHAEWPIGLELNGSYHNLALFFDRIGRSARIVNISGLSVHGRHRSAGTGTITAACVATTFVLLDEPLPPAAVTNSVKKAT